MAPHSSTLAWKIPWMEEPGRLQSMGSLESDTTKQLHFHFSLSCIGEGNGNPLQCSCLENPRDGGAGWAAVSGVTQSWTQLGRLGSSSVCVCVCVCVYREREREKDWKENGKRLLYQKSHFFGKAFLRPLLPQRGAEQTIGSLTYSLPKAGVKVGACLLVGPEGLRCSAHPLGEVMCRGQVHYPAFATGSSKVAFGFFHLYLLSIIRPNCACRLLFLLPYSFFVFSC